GQDASACHEPAVRGPNLRSPSRRLRNTTTFGAGRRYPRIPILCGTAPASCISEERRNHQTPERARRGNDNRHVSYACNDIFPSARLLQAWSISRDGRCLGPRAFTARLLWNDDGAATGGSDRTHGRHV